MLSKLLKLTCAPLGWLAGGNAVVDGCSKAQSSSEPAAEEYTLMSIDTIINGKVRPGRGSALRAPTGRVYSVFFL